MEQPITIVTIEIIIPIIIRIQQHETIIRIRQHEATTIPIIIRIQQHEATTIQIQIVRQETLTRQTLTHQILQTLQEVEDNVSLITKKESFRGAMLLNDFFFTLHDIFFKSF